MERQIEMKKAKRIPALCAAICPGLPDGFSGCRFSTKCRLAGDPSANSSTQSALVGKELDRFGCY